MKTEKDLEYLAMRVQDAMYTLYLKYLRVKYFFMPFGIVIFMMFHILTLGLFFKNKK